MMSPPSRTPRHTFSGAIDAQTGATVAARHERHRLAGGAGRVHAAVEDGLSALAVYLSVDFVALEGERLACRSTVVKVLRKHRIPRAVSRVVRFNVHGAASGPLVGCSGGMEASGDSYALKEHAKGSHDDDGGDGKASARLLSSL